MVLNIESAYLSALVIISAYLSALVIFDLSHTPLFTWHKWHVLINLTSIIKEIEPLLDQFSTLSFLSVFFQRKNKRAISSWKYVKFYTWVFFITIFTRKFDTFSRQKVYLFFLLNDVFWSKNVNISYINLSLSFNFKLNYLSKIKLYRYLISLLKIYKFLLKWNKLNTEVQRSNHSIIFFQFNFNFFTRFNLYNFYWHHFDTLNEK